MSATATTQTLAPPRRARGRMTAFIVAGTIAGLLAAALLAGGLSLLSADGDGAFDGYAATDRHGLSTPTAALVSEDLDIDLDGAGFIRTPGGLGRMRVEARATDDRPVFVGVARSEDVDRFLGGVGHTTVTDVDFGPFGASYRESAGSRRAQPPAESDIWAASAQGQGARTMTWDVRDGDWSVVVMNADGTKGVDVGVNAGVKVPALQAIGWSATGGGLLLALAATGLFVAAARRSRRI